MPTVQLHMRAARNITIVPRSFDCNFLPSTSCPPRSNPTQLFATLLPMQYLWSHTLPCETDVVNNRPHCDPFDPLFQLANSGEFRCFSRGRFWTHISQGRSKPQKDTDFCSSAHKQVKKSCRVSPTCRVANGSLIFEWLTPKVSATSPKVSANHV